MVRMPRHPAPEQGGTVRVQQRRARGGTVGALPAPRRPAPAFALFLLAPFVGEFLLGNLTLAELPLGLVLAPMHGCGALLVRELGRRSGGGWPTMGCWRRRTR
ncbi:hypothetical protein ACH4FX_36530 [Streptomyces sp. NPDC018019]|uniref:hypothetical protein n=1 Tax=Streptomyces sp. NPDC018019 TaxID=3365030 RepID=UPI0037A3E8A3